MELNDFKARLKDGRFVGCYIFSGEEDYLKRYYLGSLRDTVITDDTFATFNHVVYDGTEVDISSLIDHAMSPPMFEPYKMIEWKYPNFDKMKESELNDLEKLVDLVNDTDYAVLAFLVADGDVDLGTPKKDSKFTKRFKEKINILNFPKSTDAQLLSWLKKHFDAQSIGVTADTLRALIFRAGHTMTVLKNEVDKLSALAKARSLNEITEREVQEVVSSTPECDTFAFSNAILDKNKRMAFLALEEMKSRRLDPIMILGMMAKTYTDIATVTLLQKDGVNQNDIQSVTGMNPYKLKLYISAAKKYTQEQIRYILNELTRVDTGAKYGGIAGYTAIELFVSKYL